MFGHNWADALASGKKEICDVNFVFEIVLSYSVAVLVNQLKITNMMKFSYALK
jgi:hypothetical protein